MAWLCLGFFFCAWLGWALSPPGGTAIGYWLPGGFFVATLLLNPTREWPWFMLAILPANIGFDLLHDPDPHWFVIGWFCLTNISQATVGAWLVRRFVAERLTLTSLKELFGLLFLAGVVGSGVGATLGTAMLVSFKLTSSWSQMWPILWGGNVMAVLVLSPLMLVWSAHWQPSGLAKLGWGRRGEALLLFAGLAATLWYLLAHGGIGHLPLATVVPFILWAGLRFGLAGVVAANFWMAMLAAHLATHHHLIGLTETNQVLLIQVLVAIVALAGLVPTILLNERDRTLRELRESEDRYRNLARAAFEGIVISEHGHIVDVNRQCLKQFGCERDQMIGRPMLDFVAPESRALAAERIQERREDIVEHTLVRLDGTRFPAEVQAKVLQVGDRFVGMTAVRDITERKRVEQALRESEEKFSKAFHTSPDVISIIDLETGNYLDVNDAHEKTYGYQRPEVIGQSPLALGIHTNVAERQKILALLEAGQSVRHLEIETHPRTGGPLTMLHSAEPIEIGGRRCGLNVSHDITEEKRARALNQLQLRMLEMVAHGTAMRDTLDTLLRAIEAESPEMSTSILLVDTDGVHLRHGAAPSLPTAYTHAIDGVAMGAAVGSCGTAAFRREPVYVADIAHDPLWAAYHQLALPHGLRACWSTPIFDAQHRLLGTFAIYYRQPGLPAARHRQLIEIATHTAAICITKQHADESLLASEEALRASIEYTPNVAVQWYDALGRVVFWNRASEKMFGWTATEAVGQALAELIFTPEQALAFAAALKKIAATGEPLGPAEFMFRRRDGSSGILLSTVFRIPVRTGEMRFVCMDVDISERKQAETQRAEAIAREQQARIQYTFQLIAAQEAERKRIAAEIHDSLGQNLLLVKNLAAMALRQPDPAQTYEHLASINHLTTQCLAEARQMSRDLHPQQIEHLGLKRALEMLLENAAKASEIKFTWQFDDLGEQFPTGSATNLYRIVQESLNNILKHSRAQNVTVQLERDIHEIQLFITDDGRGFDTANLAPNRNGMGLKNIAERAHMIGGRLLLESTPTTGTRLTVTLPLAADPAAAANNFYSPDI